MRQIVKYPNAILEVKTQEVTVFDENLHSILDEMKEIMLAANGIGLSANQINLNKSMFIMKPLTVFKDGQGESIEFINPRILEKSKTYQTMNEGCLSAPGILLTIPRHQELYVQYQDRYGTMKLAILNGIEAVCFQHECLPNNSLIQTEDGLLPIKKLVDSKYAGKVLSFNTTTNTPEYQKVVDWKVQSNKKAKWVKLKTSTTGPNIQLECTDDHLCYVTNNPLKPQFKYKKAKYTKGKFLLRKIINRKRNAELGLFNSEQLSVIIGSILGDGCITKRGELAISHGEPQKCYAYYKAKILNGKIHRGWSGFREELSNYVVRVNVNEQLKKLREITYIPNKNIESILKFITPLSLAIWYMDDGCLKPGHARSIKTYPQFHTEGFSEENIDRLICLLKTKFSIKASKYKRIIRGNVKYTITILDEKRFFKLISGFIHPSMNYKVPKKYQSNLQKLNTNRIPFSLKKVIDTVRIKKESKLYDLTIENNHNFFANNTLVHNCDHLNGIFFLEKVNRATRKAALKILGLR